MKRFTQLACLILIFSMVLAIPVFAAETGTRASDYFMASSCYLYIISNTEFEVWFDVTSIRMMDELGASEIKVQRSTDKQNWSTVQTYSKEDYPQMICTNTGSHADCVTYSSAESGYYYRAMVTLYAKNSTGIAEYIRYTSYI